MSALAGAAGSNAGIGVRPGTPEAVLGMAVASKGYGLASLEHWIGRRIDATLTWNDSEEPDYPSFAKQSSLKDPYGDGRTEGLLLNLLGGVWVNLGQSWASAADGAYDARWREAVGAMEQNWRQRQASNLYVAFAHSFNSGAESIEWSVKDVERDAFKSAWRRFREILRQAMPEAVAVWCLEAGSDIDLEQFYPGDEFVDTIGVHVGVLEESFDETLARPNGLDEVQQFARTRGKPMAICGWTVDEDNAEFVSGFVPWLLANAGRAAGEVELAIHTDLHCVAEAVETTQTSAACRELQRLLRGDLP